VEDIGSDRATSMPTRRTAVNSYSRETLESIIIPVHDPAAGGEGNQRWTWTLRRSVKRCVTMPREIVYKTAHELYVGPESELFVKDPATTEK